jgi:hypothetical protein
VLNIFNGNFCVNIRQRSTVERSIANTISDRVGR